MTGDLTSGETLVGGHGSDSLYFPGGIPTALIFGNQGHDTVFVAAGAATAFGGLGDNSIAVGDGRIVVQGNEGSDTILAPGSDTISGGGGDCRVWRRGRRRQQCDGRWTGALGDRRELDRGQGRTIVNPVTFAANMGAGTGTTLVASANNALAAAQALSAMPPPGWRRSSPSTAAPIWRSIIRCARRSGGPCR